MKWRIIYAIYLIGFFIGGYCLNRSFDFLEISDPDKSLSFIANLSELLGLFIVLTEIFFLSRETEKIKKKLNSLKDFSNTVYIDSFISYTKDEIMDNKYSKAVLRLQVVKDIFNQTIPHENLMDKNNLQRKLYDTLCIIIDRLHIVSSSKKNISANDKKDILQYLTELSIEMISIKNKSINQL